MPCAIYLARSVSALVKYSASYPSKRSYCRYLCFMYKEPEREWARQLVLDRIVGGANRPVKTDAVFKLAFNNALDLFSEMADGRRFRQRPR